MCSLVLGKYKVEYSIYYCLYRALCIVQLCQVESNEGVMEHHVSVQMDQGHGDLQKGGMCMAKPKKYTVRFMLFNKLLALFLDFGAQKKHNQPPWVCPSHFKNPMH